MRCFPTYCIGSLKPADKAILVCKLHPSLEEQVRFEENIPLASTINEWQKNCPALRISFIYRESYSFGLDKYISFSSSNSTEKVTVDDCINAIKGAPEWILSKVFIEGYDKITFHFFHVSKIKKVNQLIVTLKEVPYIHLVIAKMAAGEQVALRYYEITMHGLFDDAIANINAIERLHHGQPIGTIDLSHVTCVSAITGNGELSMRKYIGLTGDNSEDAKPMVLSLETA